MIEGKETLVLNCIVCCLAVVWMGFASLKFIPWKTEKREIWMTKRGFMCSEFKHVIMFEGVSKNEWRMAFYLKHLEARCFHLTILNCILHVWKFTWKIYEIPNPKDNCSNVNDATSHCIITAGTVSFALNFLNRSITKFKKKKLQFYLKQQLCHCEASAMTSVTDIF